ncbi:MAG: hypothetical protein ACE14S_09345 [Candidatus Bathyarchaeia archaeon]
MFSETELRLLEVAYNAFFPKRHVFDVLSNPEWKKLGIEHWVQTELIIALIDAKIKVSIKDKQKKNCDLIIWNGEKEEILLELKGPTDPSNFLKDIEKGLKGCKLVLILGRVNDKILTELPKNIEKQNCIEDHKMVSPNWALMIIKKKLV